MEIKELAIKTAKEYHHLDGDIQTEHNEYILGFQDGYKQTQQNLFTEEQVREALRMKDEIEMTSFNGGEDYTEALKYDEDEIIQSLKQPKVEIEFDKNNKPVKATLV